MSSSIKNTLFIQYILGASQVALVEKNPFANAGDAGPIPGLGRSPEEGNGSPLQWENSMNRGAHWGLQSWSHKELDMMERQT